MGQSEKTSRQFMDFSVQFVMYALCLTEPISLSLKEYMKLLLMSFESNGCVLAAGSVQKENL